MADETLSVLRQIMINQALENGDKEAFHNLTGPNWEEFVVADEDEQPYHDPLAFLSEEPHFWDLRLYDTMKLHPYLNYRYRDVIDGVMYVGEIRIPIGWSGDIEVKFCPRPLSGRRICRPDWFESLISTLVLHVDLGLAES